MKISFRVLVINCFSAFNNTKRVSGEHSLCVIFSGAICATYHVILFGLYTTTVITYISLIIYLFSLYTYINK
jgi:hypothetical protein